MAAGGLVFVRFSSTSSLVVFLTCLALASSDQENSNLGSEQDGVLDGCQRLGQYMLNNPCAHPGLEIGVRGLVCGAEIPIGVFSSHYHPRISMVTANTEKYYALFMVDPDAPNHKSPKYWLHWICLNIKGKDLIAGSKVLCGTSAMGQNVPFVF
uniref:Phosphatidylethanolamine-binding protein n=1 Tax=Strigamia maritima TaxID=126957 RepID=T1II07_STRMM